MSVRLRASLLVLFPALALVPPSPAAQPLAERIDGLAAESPAAARGHWGVHAVNLATGEIVVTRNASNFFIPASNTKLFSTALALMRLGPSHRFSTRLVAARPLEGGTLRGDLTLAGGGDPTLSGRPLPYNHKAPFGDPLAALDALAAQAWESGLRRVDGDMVGDDTAYLWEPFPEGWAYDDTKFAYGAPVSALILHDNSFTLRAAAADEPGGPARVSISPSPGYWMLDSRLRTIATGLESLHLEREAGSRQIEIWGALRPGRVRERQVAVDDPALYAAYAMREALLRRGITVNGDVRARHRHPLMGGALTPPVANAETGIELARRNSAPLEETLRIIDKTSHNLHAEVVLREVARMRGAEPGREGGLAELDSFLAGIGIPASEVHFEDASGLSRLNLVTPESVTRLLRAMHASPHRDTWIGLLPVGGLDGSLDDRFRNLKQGRVVAKTGTLSHVGALSGYLETGRGETLAFAVLVNNANASGAAIREFIDKLVILLME